jgi:hypothetical protein
MQGGTLAGTAPISVTAASMTWTGGTIAGSGLLTIPNGTTVSVNGYVYFDTRAISNAGTINYSSNYYSYFYNGASLANSGTVDLQGDGGFYIASGSDSITNSGLIKKSAGTGSGGIQVPLTLQSGSQLQIQSGTLQIGNVTSAGGTISVSSGAIVYFYYTTTGSFDAASTISGAGTVWFGAGTNTVGATYNVTGVTKSSGGTSTISNITSLGDLLVGGGTLTLNSAGALSVPTLVMQGGTLNGTAPISITGTSMTWTGGTIGGSGQLTIPNGTTITVNGYVYFDTRPISNAGVVNYSSAYYSYFYSGASFANSGTVDFQGDGGFYIGGGSDSVINSGTIKKSAGTGNGGIQVPLTLQSGGQLQVQSGMLLLGNVTSTGGTMSVSSGAVAYFYYTTTSSFDAASVISGAGTVQFGAGTNTINASYNVTGATKNTGATTTITSITSVGDLLVSGGTLTLDSGSAISAPTLTMQGGTLGGTAPITLTGASMSWTGGTIGGSGQLTIPNGTTITDTGITLDTRPISNAGTINISSSGTIYMQNNAVLTNSGTITFLADGSIYLNGAAGTTALVSSGTIQKTGGTSGSSLTVPLTLQSGAQLLVAASALYLGNVTATGATLNVSSGATAYLYYTTTSSFDAASTISGAGTVQFAAGTNTVTGTYNVTGSTRASGGTSTLSSITSTGDINVSGGTLTLNGAAAISVATLTISGGTLNGSLPINLTGAAMTWSGGIIGGSGTLSIPVSTVITIGGTPALDARPVTNAGTIRFTSTNSMYLQNNAVLTTSGIVDFQGDSSIYLNSVAGTTAVANSGTIKKSAGTGNTTFNVPLTMQSGGQFLVQSGTVYFGNIASTGGSFNISSGALAILYYTTTATFDAASAVTGAGTLQNAAGTNSVAGTISASILMTGGTLSINSASAQSIPTLTMQGGTLSGSGNINLTGAAMTWTGGTLGGSGTLSVPNGTTVTISGVPTIDARTLSNAGTITFTAAYYLYMQNNAVLTNSGTISFPGDNSIYLSGAAGTTAVVDSGTISKAAGTTSYFTVPLTLQSGGQFLIQSGTIYFGNITATGGTLNVSSGAVADLYYTSSSSFDAASTITGAGTLLCAAGTNSVSGTIVTSITVSGGTLTVNSASTQSVPTLTMQGGTLSGTGNINLTGAAMTWTGGTIAGTGTLSIANGTTVTISGVPYFDNRAVSNAGTITFTTTYYVYMQNNAVLTNSGTITFPGDNAIYLSGAAGTTAVVNSGTIQKTGGTGNSYLSVPLTMQSGGQFLVQSGTILAAAITANGGTINISIGATFDLYTSDTRSFAAASSVTGSGPFLCAGGTNTFAGTITAPLALSGGTLTVNSASGQSIPSLTLSGGTLNGTAAITLTGASSTWSGGTLGGSGALNVSSATTLNMQGYPTIDTRPVSNAGTMVFPSTYYTYLQNGASLTNSGTIDFQGDSAMYLGAGSATVTNNGLLKKSAGTGTSYLNGITTTNGSTGTIQASTGTMQFTTLNNSGTLSFLASSATVFGKMSIGNAFTFGGTLSATTTGGYTPPNGTTFQVLTFPSSSGSFTTKFLSYTGGTFTDSTTATALTLTAGPSSCFATPSNIISWFKGEGNGNDSDGPNNATLSAVSIGTGKVGQALSFNGSSSNASAPDDPSLHPSSITLEGWVNFSSVPANGHIAAKAVGTGVNDSYAMWYESGALRGAVGNTGSMAPLAYTFTPATGTWYHVAFTFDGTNEALYLNGAAVATGTTGVAIGYDTHPLRIGAESDNEVVQLFFPGLIDELTLYSRALSSAEILAIYNADANGKCYVPPSAPTIGTVTPASGTVSGGTSVTVSGTNLDSVSSLTFGGSAATVTARSAGSLTVTTPAHAAGAVAVAATNPGGSVSSSNAFTYVAPPTVSGFSPSYGPPGLSIIVSGSSFTGASAVSFNGTAATFTVNNDSQITATVPSGATTGPIAVTNAAGSGASAASFIVTSASKLAILSINGGVNPKKNNPFSVVVQSQNASNVAANVFANTTVTLTLATGSGALGGTLTGIINAGSNSVTISGATYSVAESGVSITATATSGDPLTQTTSGAFAVDLPPSTYTVTNTNDSGSGSLREALTLAGNGGCASPCAISFNIAGANPQTISLASPLPAITAGNVTLDATTQPGYSGTPVVVLNGTAAGAGANGLQIAASNCTVKGLAINSFTAAGITVSGSGNVVQGNYVGTDAGGTTSLPNANGIVISGASTGNLVGGTTTAAANLIAFNNNTGVSVAASATGNQILGNRIHDNGALGIDLGADGVTANDPNDSDTGANNLQNTPVIVDAALSGSTLNVHVNVDSAGVAGTGSLRVELFQADAAGAEGQTKLASQCFAGNVLSNQLISVASAPVVSGNVLVATATSYSGSSCATVGDGTSEFSSGVPISNCTPPRVNISPAAPTICPGGNVTLDAGAGFPSYFWNGPGVTGATTQTVNATPTSTATYSVTVTDNTGCSNTASAVVTVSSATATITPSGPTTFCTGGSVTLTASAGATYSWSNGATTQSITVNNSGTFSVTVYSPAGCSATSAPTAVTVYANPPTPNITPNGPTTFCSGGSVTLSAPAGYASYSWAPGAQTAQSIAVTASGNYSVTVTDVYGCSATSTATTVTVTPAAPATITPSGPTTFCSGGSVTLTANSGTSYLWYPNGETTQSITVSTTNYYSVQVTQSGGCSSTSPQTYVVVNPLPNATITPSGPTSFCTGGSVTLTAPGGMASYLWSPGGATTPSINVTSTGSYSVTVTDNNGCSATSAPTSVNVSSGAPSTTITASGPTTFCAGGSVILAAPAGAASYLWSNGATTQSINVTTSGNYSVTVYSAGGCNATSSPTTVTVNPAPTVTITPSGPTSFCTGGSVTLTATAGMASYSWSNGATTQSINATTTGNYTVTATDANGCSGTSAPVAVNVSSSAGTVSISAPATVGANSTGNAASVPAGPSGTTYTWSIGGGTITSGQGTPSITFSAGVTSPINIAVSVVTGSCTSTGTASVTVNSSADLKVAATAAPNPVSSGGTITFTINVANAGPNNALNVEVNTTLAGATFAAASGSGWSCGSGSPIVCTLAALPPGNAAPIVITATAGNGSSAVADVLVLASSNDPNSGDNSTSAAVAISAQQPQCNNSAPSLAAPADGATVQSPAALSWTASANATSYDVWASTGNNAPAIVATTASTSANVALPSGAVTWYVGAHFPNNCPTLFSAPRSFTVAAAQTCNSAKAQLSAPLGGTVASPVTFTWQAPAQAIGYRVWVEIDGGGAQDVATTNGATTATVALTGHSVKWYVEAQFPGCPPTFSDPATFQLAAVDSCAGHGAAQLVAPADKSIAPSSVINFEWTAVPNASGYLVWASIDSAPFGVLGTRSAETQFQAVIAHGHVEWYVEAQFNGCPSTESAHRSFDIPAAQVCTNTPATNLSPANVTLTNGAVDFSWTPVPNAVGYELWLGLSGATPSVVASTPVPSLHTTVAAGAIEYFVRTFVSGCDLVDSAHATFTYIPPPNCPAQAPMLVTPADNAQLVSPVDFSAAAVPGTTQYRLFIGNTQVATSAAPLFLGIPVPVGPVSWSVEAAVDGCAPVRSAAGSFTIIDPPPPCADPAVPSLRADATASDGVKYFVRLSPLPNALYEIQEATSSSFADAQGTTSSSPQFSFSHVAPTADPVLFHYRARSINQCNGNRSQFSDEVTVTVLSSKSGDSSEANGSTPADNPQVTHYQILIGGSSGIAASVGTMFTATTNVAWLTVTPSSGIVPAGGITLDVAADPKGLPVGTNTGAVDVKFGSSSAAGSRVAPRDGGGSTTTVSVNLVQPVSPTAKSGPPPDALIIPAVAHAAGINSQFQSDVRLTNTAAITIKYQLTFTPSGEDGSKDGRQTTLSVDPGRTIALDDVLQSWFGEQAATGTLEIRPLTATAVPSGKAVTGLANLTTFAASRTFNNTSCGTFGQFIPAIPFAQFVGKDGNSVLSLQQVAQSSAYRTNLGLVEGSGNPVTALISIFGSDGKKLTEFTQSLNGGQHLQLNSVIASKGLTVSDGRIEVKPISGNGKLTAYASVLNNETSDPLLVSPVAVNTLGASKYVLAGVADLNNGFANWRTDMRVYNAGAAPVSAKATFVAQNGDTKSADLTLAPGEVKVLDNVLADTFGVTNTGGAVSITTASTTSLVASARTYNVTSNGIYGQFIGAVTPSDAAALGTRSLQLLQVEESNRYRTNVGIAEVAGKSAKVEISVIPPDSKVAATTTVDLAPNQFIQFNQLLKSIGFGDDVYNARVTLRVVEGQGRITGYASVVDMQTGDPSFVQAQ